MSPSYRRMIKFESVNDVYDELIRCYDNITDTEDIGEVLYTEHFFFANTSELIEKRSQEKIKVYNYCKTFNCPPYPSIIETPAKELEELLIIDSEVKKHNNSKKEEVNGDE